MSDGSRAERRRHQAIAAAAARHLRPGGRAVVVGVGPSADGVRAQLAATRPDARLGTAPADVAAGDLGDLGGPVDQVVLAGPGPSEDLPALTAGVASTGTVVVPAPLDLGGLDVVERVTARPRPWASPTTVVVVVRGRGPAR